MYRVMVVIRRKPGLSREEFLDHWQRLHPAFVAALPRVRRYRQHPVIEHKTAWPFDGIAELWFDSVKDVAVAFDGPEAKALFEHEKSFIGEMSWAITEGQDVDLI